jgi:hypothetical protein
MIRLLFTYEREVLIFEIENKVIVYRDRKWQTGIKFIPKDVEFVKKVIFSRNALSHNLIKWIAEANSGKSLAEWQACKDDEEVAEIVKRDACSRGCVFKNKSYGTEKQEDKHESTDRKQE